MSAMSDLYYDPTDTERWDAAVAAYSGSDDEVNDALEWLADEIDKDEHLRRVVLLLFFDSSAWEPAVRRTMR